MDQGSSTSGSWYEALLNRRMLICIFTGFSSGLPLWVFISLMPAWLKDAGISLKTIGAMSLIMLPYTWKFLWSPLLDRYTPTLFGRALLGRRRGWMLISQVLLLAGIAGYGLLDPVTQLSSVIALSVVVAFLSASQDIVLDAYRREILPDAELGLGNAIHVNAYKIASLVPGALSLILADHLPWAWVFPITALSMLPGILMAMAVQEPQLAPHAARSLSEAVLLPFREFFTRHGARHALLVLLFMLFYKLGDSMATALATPFYMEMGFSKSEIGAIAKVTGLWASVAGGMLGGLWMIRLGIVRALWLFGVAQWLPIFGFVVLAQVGHDHWTLALVIGAEAFGTGLGTAAFVAYIASLTDVRYTATQFALLTSLAALPRTLFNASTGVLAEALGWVDFFLLCGLLALPGMLLLFVVAPWPLPKRCISGS